MREWYSAQDMSAFDRHKLRLSSKPAELNKAGLDIEYGRYLVSLAVWGQGTIELIVVNGKTREEVIVEDTTFQTLVDLHSYLSLTLERLLSLPK